MISLNKLIVLTILSDIFEEVSADIVSQVSQRKRLDVIVTVVNVAFFWIIKPIN